MSESKEKFRAMPTRIHKSMVIAVLKSHPKDYPKLMAEMSKEMSVEECIAMLEKDPREWFVDGELSRWMPEEKETS